MKRLRALELVTRRGLKAEDPPGFRFTYWMTEDARIPRFPARVKIWKRRKRGPPRAVRAKRVASSLF